MSLIRVHCETCGDANVTDEQITLRICRQTCDAAYRFLCPHCHLIQVKDALPRVGELLVRYGVCVEWFDLPLELTEVKDHPPITLDDLIDAHFELEQM